jgi:hypothetical protein
MSVSGVHQPRRVSNQANLGAGLRIDVQVLAEDWLPELLVESFVPGLRFGVDGKELVV